MSHSSASPVTALMPLRHYEPRFLDEALDSLAGQTSPDWRLVVIAEPGDLVAFRMLLARRLEDPRVTLVANEGRKLAGAFNTGMRAATSEFVAILLADDRWAPHAVETLHASIRAHPEADFFHSGRRIIDGDGRALSGVYAPPDRVSAEDFVWAGVVKHLLCWRRAMALAAGGMDESLNSVGPDDYDFPWTMLEHGAVFRAVNDCLYLYRDHRDGYRLTTHLPRSVHLRELRRILRKHGVSERLIRERLRASKRGYLRECLYRNELHRRLALLLRRQPGTVWRQTYR